MSLFTENLWISRGNAITAFVDVECVASDHVPFVHKKKFVLPHSLLGAVVAIRTHIHINRIHDIPDSMCKKSLKLHVNDRSKLMKGFSELMKILNEASKKGAFELIVEGVD